MKSINFVRDVIIVYTVGMLVNSFLRTHINIIIFFVVLIIEMAITAKSLPNKNTHKITTRHMLAIGIGFAAVFGGILALLLPIFVAFLLGIVVIGFVWSVFLMTNKHKTPTKHPR